MTLHRDDRKPVALPFLRRRWRVILVFVLAIAIWAILLELLRAALLR